MRPGTQRYTASLRRRDGHTIDGIPGDCFRTALACLLDLHPEDVPHFGLRLSWWEETRRWLLAAEGLDLAYVPADEALPRVLVDLDPETPVMVGGPSPRGAFGHVCVGLIDGTVLWDPHPSRAGLASVDEFFVLVEPYGHLPGRLMLEAAA